MKRPKTQQVKIPFLQIKEKQDSQTARAEKVQKGRGKRERERNGRMEAIGSQARNCTSFL